MRFRSSILTLALLACAALAPPRALRAQADAQRKPLTLALTLAPEAQLDGEQLRAQLERELRVVVVTAELPAEVTSEALRIEAPSLAAVRVAFRGSARTVDLSSTGPHAVETLALLAANLMRDEAADLLATLRASEPEPRPAVEPEPKVERTQAPERRGCDPNRYRSEPLAVNLVPYVGTSSFTGLEIEQALAFHLIGGSAGALNGVEIAGVFNHEAYAVCGAQIAGAINLVNGPVRGVQASMINLADGRVEGAQLALLNISSGTLHGVQAALLNLALEGGDAVQAGLLNVSGDGLRGAQAGLVNTTTGDSSGVQLGLVNVTTGRARGLMLGLANFAGDADAAVGLLNIHTKGRTQLEVWTTDAALLMVGLEHGGRLMHNIFGVGFTSRDGNGVFAFAYGLGARVHEGAMTVDVDGLGYGLITQGESQDNADFASILQLRVPLGFRVVEGVTLVASPALNISVARTADNTLGDPSLYGARVTSAGAPVTALIWPGVTLGARFF